MSDRSVHKTIRLSQESYDFIESLPGDSWNDRFNKALEEMLHGKERRERELRLISDQVESRRETLRQLDSMLHQCKQMLGSRGVW